MVLICTGDLRLAYEAGGAIGNRPVYAFSPAGLFSATRTRNPMAVVLGVRAGGNCARAVEWIPFLRELSRRTEIVVLTHSPTAAEASELDALGAYACVDVEAAGWRVDLADIIAWLRRRRAPPGQSGPIHGAGHQ
jgi:hypothetical protein